MQQSWRKRESYRSCWGARLVQGRAHGRWIWGGEREGAFRWCKAERDLCGKTPGLGLWWLYGSTHCPGTEKLLCAPARPFPLSPAAAVWRVLFVTCHLLCLRAPCGMDCVGHVRVEPCAYNVYLYNPLCLGLCKFPKELCFGSASERFVSL